MIIVKTDDPEALRDAILQAAATDELQTWTQTTSDRVTHSPEDGQWDYLAEIELVVHGDELRGLYKPDADRIKEEKKPPQSVYGIYMGRFASMLITHFCDEIEDIRITPKVLTSSGSKKDPPLLLDRTKKW